VLDEAGAPVGRAEVWLEGQGEGSLGGRIVARAVADGSFHLRALGGKQALGAFAPGFAPAALELVCEKVRAPGSSEAHVTLVLGREGRELHGIVLDPSGRPVGGARVALGTRGNFVDGRVCQPRARVFTTGDDGEFRAWVGTGVPRGMPLVLVHALAPGFALARVEENELGTPVHEVRVRLEVGATIEGVVRAADGRAVAGARVELRSAGALEGQSSPFRLPSTRTGADGAYRLEHVPYGEVHLGSASNRIRRGAEETRTLANGTHERWDLTLGAARVITGRVVDEQGAPLAQQTLAVSDGRWNEFVTTDDGGAFVFAPSRPSAEWTLSLLGPGGVLDVHEHVPVGSEVVLVSRSHHAAVHGGFTDRAGLARESEAVLACLRPTDESRMVLQAEIDAQGAFAFEGVRRGTYRVRIESGERRLAESPEFTLAEDQVLELPWLESIGPGPR
jgi:protocatechuate 3,4-dioxygenase beta subunit